jgi:hypothetical protein
MNASQLRPPRCAGVCGCAAEQPAHEPEVCDIHPQITGRTQTVLPGNRPADVVHSGQLHSRSQLLSPGAIGHALVDQIPLDRLHFSPAQLATFVGQP